MESLIKRSGLFACLNDFHSVSLIPNRQTSLVYIHVVSSCMPSDKSVVGTSLNVKKIILSASKVVLLISSVFHAFKLLFNVGVYVFVMRQCKLSEGHD